MKAVMKKTILIGVAAVAPAAFLQGCRGGDKAKTDEDKANLRKQNNPVQSGKQSEDEAEARKVGEAESEGLRSADTDAQLAALDQEFAALENDAVPLENEGGDSANPAPEAAVSTAPASVQEKSPNKPEALSVPVVAAAKDEKKAVAPAAEAAASAQEISKNQPDAPSAAAAPKDEDEDAAAEAGGQDELDDVQDVAGEPELGDEDLLEEALKNANLKKTLEELEAGLASEFVEEEKDFELILQAMVSDSQGPSGEINPNAMKELVTYLLSYSQKGLSRSLIDYSKFSDYLEKLVSDSDDGYALAAARVLEHWAAKGTRAALAAARVLEQLQDGEGDDEEDLEEDAELDLGDDEDLEEEDNDIAANDGELDASDIADTEKMFQELLQKCGITQVDKIDAGAMKKFHKEVHGMAEYFEQKGKLEYVEKISNGEVPESCLSATLARAVCSGLYDYDDMMKLLKGPEEEQREEELLEENGVVAGDGEIDTEGAGELPEGPEEEFDEELEELGDEFDEELGDVEDEDGNAPEGNGEDDDAQVGAVPQDIEGGERKTIGGHETLSFGTASPARVVALFLGLNTTIDNLLQKDLNFVRGLPEDSDDTRFILVQAKNMKVQNIPMDVPSWFPRLVPNGDQDLEAPSQFVHELLETIKSDYGVDRDMVHLMGISQGGAVALWAGSKYGVAAITSILGFWPSFESHVPNDDAVQKVHHVNFLSSPEDQFFAPTRGNELSKLELERGFGSRLTVQEVNQEHAFDAPITSEMREAVLACLKTWKDASQPPALPTQAERDNLYAQIGALRPQVQQQVVANVQQKVAAMVQERAVQEFGPLGGLLAAFAGGADPAGNEGNPLDMLAGFAAGPRNRAHAGTIRAGGF